ncbi:MAG: hypothetical protein IMZ63_03790 [Actinobacteria bacterium]|nr:hypothetical protein [Actinomycetota bacterium]
MLKVLIILALIAGISFFISKYFWIRTPTDTKTISKEILSAEEKYCEGGICPVPEEYLEKLRKEKY